MSTFIEPHNPKYLPVYSNIYLQRLYLKLPTLPSYSLLILKNFPSTSSFFKAHKLVFPLNENIDQPPQNIYLQRPYLKLPTLPLYSLKWFLCHIILLPDTQTCTSSEQTITQPSQNIYLQRSYLKLPTLLLYDLLKQFLCHIILLLGTQTATSSEKKH